MMAEDAKKLSRREFLKLAGVAGAVAGTGAGLAGLLSACGGETTTTTTAAAATATTARATTTTAATTATTGAATTVTTGAAANEKLRVGCVMSLTGKYSSLEAAEPNRVLFARMSSLDAAEVDMGYVARMINDGGGIRAGGKTYDVELLIEDNKSDLTGNAEAVVKLVMGDKVKFAVGPGAYFNAQTVSLFEEAKVLHVATRYDLDPAEMGPSTPYGFLGLDPIAQASAALNALRALFPKVRTLIIAVEEFEYAYYKGYEQVLEELVARTGLVLTGYTALNHFTVLFQPNARGYKKVKAIGADAVWTPSISTNSFSQLVKGLRGVGYTAPIVLPVDIDAPTAVGLAGPEASHNIVGILNHSLDDPNLTDPFKKLLKMGDSNRRVIGSAPNALYMLKSAIEAADSIDPTAVRDKWQTLSTIPTLYGDGFPTGAERFGMKNHAWAHPVPVCLINKGKIEYKPWVAPDVTP
jgi:branched-chain amino acid transport system substrate-binding protein